MGSAAVMIESMVRVPASPHARPSRSRLVTRALAIGLALGTALAGCGGDPAPSTAAVVTASPSPSESPSPSRSPSPSPSPLPSAIPVPSLQAGVADLTGLHVANAAAHRLPIAVLIDDNRIARPQSGFNGASIVYQAPADGGETRYMFVYGEQDARDIGPVRSGRIYFVNWASETRSAIAHYGGDLQARKYLSAHDKVLFTNVDALGKGSKAYHRITTHWPPHNGYTSSAALRAMAKKIGGPVDLDASFLRRTFVDPAPLTVRPAGQKIRVPYRTGIVDYTYQRSTNLYLRNVDGHAQIDPADRRRVTTTNVVILFMAFHTDSTIEPGHARPVLGSIGQGPAWVFREGRLVKGTWEKASATAPTRLLDAAGGEIPLVRGRTFFQIVPATTKVSVRAT